MSSFIFANGRFLSKNVASSSSSASSNQVMSAEPNNLSTYSFGNEQQISEEIEDDDDETTLKLNAAGIEEACDELRTFDDYNSTGGYNEDEFFLISTPSPFNIGAAGHHFHLMDQQDDNEEDDNEEEEEEEEDDDDEDEVNDYNQQMPQKPINMLRYQVQYELNRLSNIIEEEDFNYEEEDQKESLNEQMVPEAATQKNDGEPHDMEPPTHSETYLEQESVKSFKEMLILGEQITNSYNSMQNELSTPTVVSTGCNYKPVMKKRVYQLNSAYAKSDEDTSKSNDISKSEQVCLQTFKLDNSTNNQNTKLNPDIENKSEM